VKKSGCGSGTDRGKQTGAISSEERHALTLQRSIHQGLRKLGVDIIRYPFPEWLALREHLLTLFSKFKINCVLDVGANRGFYAGFLRAAGFEGRIVSFEPIGQSFLELQNRSSADPEWHACQIALGREAGTFPMNITHRTELCSFLSPNEYCKTQFGKIAEIVATEMVKVERLDRIFDECVQGICEPKAFLKMDTQGYDLKVLEGAAGRLNSIEALQSEISFRQIYHGMPNFEESIGKMAQRGFELTGLFPVQRDERLRIVEMDCVMVKSHDWPSTPG
jgi:FkbM family methyltransferase